MLSPQSTYRDRGANGLATIRTARPLAVEEGEESTGLTVEEASSYRGILWRGVSVLGSLPPAMGPGGLHLLS